MPPGPDDTLTIDADPAAPKGHPPDRPTLFLALECDRPLAPPARFALDEVDEVVLGRGSARDAHRTPDDAGGRRLSVTVEDRRMSTRHARLHKSPAGWAVEDAGSKNGTLLNGAPVDRALLGDGDLLELGHTLFLFRESLAADRGPAEDTPAGAATAPGLATLLPSLARDLATLREIAGSRVPVVLLGETGTGKELAARAVHALSGRLGLFVAVNCGALPETLVETELFGYRKGAFSGALEDRPGLVRAADGGTLFLDEIGDLPPSSQAAFLRLLQEQEVTPVGATRPIRVDVRLVAATNRDLGARVADGHFRPDLLARIAGCTIRLPPLRDRLEDLGLLVGTLLRRIVPDRPEAVRISGEAARALFRYRWPFNIRELEKSLGAAVVLARGERIELDHLPAPLGRAAPVGPPAAAAAGEPELRPTLTDEDLRRREELVRLLREHNGNVSAVSRAMGKARMQIHRWLKRYGLEPQKFQR